MTVPIKYRISSVAAKPVADSVKGVPLTSLEIDGNFRSLKDSVELSLDNALPIANYTALRNYPLTGTATTVRITTPGIAGFFTRRGTTGLSDNGGTVIIDAGGRAWERVFDGAVNVKWFGAVGDGSNETSKFLAACAASEKLVIPSGMVLSISNAVLSTDVHIVIESGAVLKHFADSNKYMLHSLGNLRIDGGGTIDGNFQNKPTRSVAVRASGFGISVMNAEFINTYEMGIFADAVIDHVEILNNKFHSMAEHGGVLGQVAQAIYVGNARSVAIRGNRFVASAPSLLGRSPGGIQVAVSDASVYSTDCIIEGNHFERIGMSAAANYLGCIDLYTNAKNTVVANNVCIDSAYIPIKLQNSPNVSVTGNVISGFTGDTSVSAAMILYANARNFAYPVNGVTISGNIIDLGTDTTQICVNVIGATAYITKSVVVNGNTTVGGARGVVLSYVTDTVVSNNVIRQTAQAIRFVDQNDAGGIVSICGNTIKEVTHGILATSSKMMDAVLNITGNTFSGVATASISLGSDATRVMKAVNVIGNVFADVATASGNIVITYAQSANVQSNLGISALPFDYSNIATLREQGNTWNLGLVLQDGVVVPATKSGIATLYVDSADGDLKIKFGDGVVKTITTDV